MNGKPVYIFIQLLIFFLAYFINVTKEWREKGLFLSVKLLKPSQVNKLVLIGNFDL